ncbi:stork-head domain-containing protein knockout [Amblyomma americanum]
MAPRPEDRRRCLLLGNCLVVVCRRVGSDDDQDDATQDRAGPPGWSLFRGFVHENAQCFWNQCLVQSVACLEYRGYLIPSTIFVSGNEYTLEVVRSAWSRRVLRPPVGYEIQKLGDVSSVEMVQVLQTQFAPLAEALCKAVFDLTSRGSTATLDTISAQLGQAFPAIERPGADVVYRALGALIRERRLYHTGLGYQVAAPDTFLQTSPSPVPTERPMLLTNEEAISRLHGSPAHTTDESAADGSTLERSASMRLLRTRAGASDEGLALGSRLSRSSSVRLCRSSPAHDGLSPAAPSAAANGKRGAHQDTGAKRDGKSSMFSRWFRRSRSEKRSSGECKKQLSSFSAQFPPLEWSDPDYARFHSRATQTSATTQPDTHPYAALLKPRSSSTNRARERHSSNGETPDASLDRSDRRSRSSRGYYRGPRKAAALAATEDLDSSGTLMYRHRSASPAARRNNHNQNNGSRHGGTLAQSSTAPSRRLPSTAEIRTPPLSRRAYRHQRALPPLPVERLNNGGLRQDDQRYRPPNFTNNALEKAGAGEELPPSGKGQQPSDYTNNNNNNRLPRAGPVPLATFEARRSSIAGTTLDIDNVATSRIRAEAQRHAPTAFSMKNLQQQPSATATAFPMRGGAHISADDLKNLHKAEEKVEPRPIAAIKNLQCGPMVISKVPPQPQIIEPRRTTTTTTFTTTDTVTLKNIQNLSSVADLDKTKPSPQTLKNLQPSTNTTTVSIKQTNGKIDDDGAENTKKIATNLILEEKIEAQRKSGAASPSVAGPIKKIVEEKSVQSTLESTGKMGNLKSTVDVNMELVTEVGSSRTVTNITTSLQHALPKPVAAEPPSQEACNNKSAAAGKTTKASKPAKMNGSGGGYTPTRAKLAEAKAAFFADSANKGSADDSGFVSTSPQPVPV